MSTERRTFYGPDIDIPSLAQALADHFSRDGYQTQIVPVSNTALMVQAQKEDTLRKMAGMSSALSAVLSLEGEYVAAEIGGAKWADKGVAAGVGAIIFFPVLITAGVGAYQQSQLTSKAWQFVEQFVRTHSQFAGQGAPLGQFGQPPSPPGYYQQPGLPQAGFPPPPLRGAAPPPPPPANFGRTPQAAAVPQPAPVGTVCASCGQAMTPGSKFCMACGAPATRTCFSCGVELQPTARFCNNCGSPVAQ